MVCVSGQEIDPAQGLLDNMIDAEDGIVETSGGTVEIAARLDELERLLEPARWANSTTGVGFIEFFGSMVRRARTDTAPLARFLEQTFDDRTCSFRPFSVSEFMRAEHGLSISHKTVGKMLGKLADAGRKSRPAVRPAAAMMAAPAGDAGGGGSRESDASRPADRPDHAHRSYSPIDPAPLALRVVRGDARRLLDAIVALRRALADDPPR